MPQPLVLVMAAFALLSVVLLILALAAVRKRRWIGTGMAFVLAVLFLALAAVAATVGVAMQGYRALTREVVAATVVTRPIGSERFVATFIAAREPTQLELRVSTSGLLFRRVGQTAQGASTGATRR